MVYASESLQRQFPLDPSRYPHSDETRILSLSEKRIGKLLALLGLGLSVSEVVNLLKHSKKTVCDIVQWNRQHFRKPNYRKLVIRILNSEMPRGDWVWRLRALWSTAEVDDLRRRVSAEFGALHCTMEEGGLLHQKLDERVFGDGSEMKYRDSWSVEDELIKRRTYILGETAEHDLNMRMRSYDPIVREAVTEEPEIVTTIVGRAVGFTAKGRFQLA